MSEGLKIWALHLVVLLGLLLAPLVLPAYHSSNLARIMCLAIFAMGYNLAFGYTGLLSLGHALFFAAGIYATGLPIWHFGLSAGPALLLAALGGALLAGLIGLMALRAKGVAFMIVTMMFAQAGYLTLLYFRDATGGEDGFALPAAGRVLAGHDLSQDGPRYLLAWGLFALMLSLSLLLIRSRFGRVMMAMRENEQRSRMLGYNPFKVQLFVLMGSGLYAGVAGGAYALLFGYAGASFATIQYSVLPLLYVLLGGAGTVLGPLLGTALMFYLIEKASEWTSAYGLVVGAVLIILILFMPSGLLGWWRRKFWRALP